MRFIRNFQVVPRPYALLIGLLLTLGAKIIDFYIPPELSSTILYLPAVLFTAWYGGYAAGLLIAALSAVGWLITDSGCLGSNFCPTHANPIVFYWNTVVQFVKFGSIAYLIAALRRSYEREWRHARTDELTHAVNRRYFLELLQIELDRLERYHRTLTLVYLDVDHFKQINDQFGHSTGDRLLATIASTVRRQIRSSDVFARLGGDEFALLLPETTSPQAEAVLTRLFQALTQEMQQAGWQISFSVGAVTFNAFPGSVDRAIELADRAMYDVKSTGKNRLMTQVYEG